MRAELPRRQQLDGTTHAELPAVGDWVLVEIRPSASCAAVRRVLARKSAFQRKVAGSQSRTQVVAANIETAFLTVALTEDFNLRRLERYLALAWESGAEPVVLLTKADLCVDVDERLAQTRQVAHGVAVHAISVREDRGLEALGPYLASGRTSVLMGSSGVGKSSLVNRLAGEELLLTQATGDDGTGRQTTSQRQLVRLPSGGLIVDTPGMRELGLWGGAEAGLGRVFEDLAELATGCRFRDCQHASEPGCAVLAALDSGALDPERLQSWRKLQRELAFEQNRGKGTAAQAVRAKWKRVYKEAQERRNFERR